MALASDGLFIVLTKEEVVSQILRMQTLGFSLGQISDNLCNLAVDRGSTDNTTLVLIDLKKYYAESQQETATSSPNQSVFHQNLTQSTPSTSFRTPVIQNSAKLIQPIPKQVKSFFGENDVPSLPFLKFDAIDEIVLAETDDSEISRGAAIPVPMLSTRRNFSQ